MNRFSTTTAVLLSCWLCAEKLSAAFPEVDRARQCGAQGQVTFRVVDSKGSVVEGAKISGAFFPSDSYADAKVFEGHTDTNGLFAAKGTTVEDINYAVTKEGFYKTTGKYWFYRRGENCVRDGRWQPWNPIHTVVLREKRNPVPMYVKRISMPMPVRELSVGFNLEKGDWIAPYGKGISADLTFIYDDDIKDFWTGTYKLKMECPGIGNGLYKKSKETGSLFASDYEAADNGLRSVCDFVFSRTKDKILKDERVGDTEYLVFRVKTEIDEKGNVVRAKYGKIYGPVEFGITKERLIQFIYYFNPDGTRNLEFDPNRNLFGNGSDHRIPMP